MFLESISLRPEKLVIPDYLIVALHGWGANAEDLVPIASQLNLSGMQFLFAEAPYPHSQVPWGRAWYHLETPDYKGLKESRQALFEWLLSLEASTGVPITHTLLVGFSQGAAMTLDVGLNLPLMGLCSLSGYLHLKPERLNSPIPPILMIHGTEDSVVPIEKARSAHTLLTSLGANIDYHELKMRHEISQEAINLLRDFIVSRYQAISH